MKKYTVFLIVWSVAILSCKKEKEELPIDKPNSTKIFENISFDKKKAFFSTDGSMSVPIDSNQAKVMSNKIDITFIYNDDYTEAGFFDPIARSQEWYWDYYYLPWLSNAVETRYYDTNLSKSDFEAAKNSKSKIAEYFSDASVVLAPHGIYPEGSCIGGRETYDPNSILLSVGKVFGFKNTASGKRGLLYIRTDQNFGWPTLLSNYETKVDIIRED